MGRIASFEKECKGLESAGLSVSFASCQGKRPEQEDSEIVEELDLSGHVVLGVFDGHGGATASVFAAENFVSIMVATSSFKRYSANLARLSPSHSVRLIDPSDMASCIWDLGEALKETFALVDKELVDVLKESKDSSGATGCIVIITPTYILCANVGDSRCVLSVDGFTKALSTDHKPEDMKERERIERAGGKVHQGRIDGELAVARAIGDFKFKAKTSGETPEGLNKVICTPDIKVHARTEHDDFLVLACDGLWDVYSSSEVLLQISSLLFAPGNEGTGGSSTKAATETMIDLAISNGSMDNVTCAVCRFL
jgi:serine/threonine protein phosphatase PrpC